MAAVASANPFSILSEDASAPPAKSATPEKQKAETPAPRGGQKGRTGGPASRGGRYYQRGGGAPSAPREPAETDDAAPREGKRSGDERGRGRGGRGRGRGERRGGGHGRLYDRQSATGKTDSDKKIAQGWGGPDGDRELQAEEQGTKDAADEEAPPADDPWGVGETAGAGAVDDPWGVTPAPEASGDTAKEGAPAETRRPKEEEEDHTLTLDEYQAKLKETSVVPKLENVRQANDGADDLFKDAVQVVKPEEDTFYAGKTKTPKQRAKKEDNKKQVPVELVFDGPFADRHTRGRGGRGGDRGFRGGRGRGGRGRGRGDGANGQSVNLRDESDFPSLPKS